MSILNEKFIANLSSHRDIWQIKSYKMSLFRKKLNN
jgi:hypothetical protein